MAQSAQAKQKPHTERLYGAFEHMAVATTGGFYLASTTYWGEPLPADCIDPKPNTFDAV